MKSRYSLGQLIRLPNNQHFSAANVLLGVFFRTTVFGTFPPPTLFTESISFSRLHHCHELTVITKKDNAWPIIRTIAQSTCPPFFLPTECRSMQRNDTRLIHALTLPSSITITINNMNEICSTAWAKCQSCCVSSSHKEALQNCPMQIVWKLEFAQNLCHSFLSFFIVLAMSLLCCCLSHWKCKLLPQP